MKKIELYKKIQNADPKYLKKLNITDDEWNFIKNKLINDKLGLTINFQEIDEKISKNYFGFEEIKDLNINAGNKNNHLIIEGDNYHALKALSIANVKIDVIYIDPPYNTGKNFIYNDDFSTKKEVGKDDPHKHSKWLSFMKKRMILAKELLSDNGIIFISIDDNEQAYLKVLMDEIFGEENFVSNMPRKTRSGGGRYGKNYISDDLDYILTYSKNFEYLQEFVGINIKTDDFNFEDNIGKYNLKHPLDGGQGQKEYQLEILEDGVLYKPRTNWAFSDSRVKWFHENNMLIFKKSNKVYVKNYKNFKVEKLEKTYKLVQKDEINPVYKSSFAHNNEYLNARGTSSLKEMGLKFDFSKPSKLIEHLISITNMPKNITILDFFAGSGTTGQAIMELNKDDEGNRRFILVTNNENNIATDICRERIYRVINGHGSKNESIDWKFSKETPYLEDNNVKYLRLKEINKIDGEYEDINVMKNLYKDEFNKEISIRDFHD